MDFNYSRSFAITLARRAIEDIRRDGFRQLRNYVDMCAVLSKKPHQIAFFDYAQQALEKTDSLYYGLIQRLLNTVSEERIITVGVNLAFDGLIYGASKIRRAGCEGDAATPWLNLAFCDALPQPEQVEAREEKGSFSWMLYLTGPLPESVVDLASRFPHSVFGVVGQAQCFDEASLKRMEGCNNLVPIIHLFRPELSPAALDAAERMRRLQLFYGYACEVDDASFAQAICPEWVAEVSKYSLLCIYARRPGISQRHSSDLGREIIRARLAPSDLLLPLDWDNDIPVISGCFGPGNGVDATLLGNRPFPMGLMNAE